jgi:hypothetical protein
MKTKRRMRTGAAYCWLICVAKVALAQPASVWATAEQPAAAIVAISGRVIDALGQPIRGATVTVEGMTTWRITRSRRW